MSRMGLWQIADAGPVRLSSASVDLEAHLEEWIERDPTLVQSGLVIVGRQITNPAGRIDLLGRDPQGRWVVIEIKRGDVTRETIAAVQGGHPGDRRPRSGLWTAPLELDYIGVHDRKPSYR